MRKYYAVYDLTTGKILQVGVGPEIDLPKPTDQTGVLIVPAPIQSPQGKRVVNGQVVDG